MRLLIVCVVLSLCLFGVACRESDNPGATPRPSETAPGQTPVAGSPSELLHAHLRVEFGEEDWVDDVGDVTIDGFAATIQLDRDRSDKQAFDEFCTAAAGFLMQRTFQAHDVIVEDEDGNVVTKAVNQRPQCEPVAVSR